MKSRKMVVGVAWYRPQDWNRLREICVDPESLEESHGEWLKSANAVLRKFEGRGLRARKVIIDLDRLIEFCRSENLEVDGAARSKFVAQAVREEENP